MRITTLKILKRRKEIDEKIIETIKMEENSEIDRVVEEESHRVFSVVSGMGSGMLNSIANKMHAEDLSEIKH